MPSPLSLGLYIHIPFCHARCGYCDFVTFTGKEHEQDRYVQTLCRELAQQAKGEVSGRPLDTIFFGGGTPTLLTASQIQHIFNAIRQNFSLTPKCEITFEANPESVSPEGLAAWRAAGANRVSLGLQAFDDRLLKAMDRLHSVEGFLNAFQAVRNAGFKNASVDLIYGFPEQSLLDWQETVRRAAELGPEHLSLYALTIEAHTPFAERGVRVNDDSQAAMYAWAREFLSAQGYEQYEVSNFARAGYPCQHNLLYWRQQDYLGLGVGAVGCVGTLRWQNEKNLGSYYQAMESRKLPRLSEERLDEKTARFERLMLGLRLREGLEWGEEENDSWVQHRSRLTREGLLEEIQPGRWRVADRAVPVLNQVLLPFL